METDFKSEDVCRICLSSGEEMQELFVKDSGLVDQIEYCTGLLLLPAPSLPTLICEACLSQLHTAHAFKTTCLASNNSLHSQISSKDNTITIKKNNKTVSCMIPIMPITVKVETEEQDDVDAGGDEMDDGMDDEWVDTVRKSKRVKMKKEREDSPVASLPRAPKRGPHQRRARRPQERPGAPSGDKPADTWLGEMPPEELFKVRRVPCRLCDGHFTSRVELAAHRARAHPPPAPAAPAVARPKPRGDKLWICEFCGKTFTNQGTHYTHVRSHLPPRHACARCPYRTGQRHDLTKHQRIHNGEKNFQCAACPKSFYNSSNLLAHTRRTHERLRPHACALCPKRFYDRTKLRRHQDSHDAIKRFECEVCHSCFTRRCYWKKHLQKQHGVVIPPAKSGRQKLNFIVGEDLMEAKTDWPPPLPGTDKRPAVSPPTAGGLESAEPKDAVS